MAKHSPVKRLTPEQVAGLNYTAPKPSVKSKEWGEGYKHGNELHAQNEQETYRKWMKNLYVECRHVEHVSYDGKRPRFGCECEVCMGTATHVTIRTPSRPCERCGTLVLKDENHSC